MVEVILQRRDTSSPDAFPHHIDILDCTNGGMSLVWETSYTDRRATDIKVADGYMVVTGFIRSYWPAGEPGPAVIDAMKRRMEMIKSIRKF